MMRFLRLCWFHFKLYTKNSYFVWLPISSTISIFLLQYLGAYASGTLASSNIWLISGTFGMWASTTTAAGSIGFQRYMGTLQYIVNTRIDDRVSVAAAITPASTYGLLAYLVALVMSVILRVGIHGLTIGTVLAIISLWLSALIMSLFIAAFFVFTPNAMTYEELIMIPILLLSGLFSLQLVQLPIFSVFQWLLPLATPIKFLLTEAVEFDILPWLSSLVLWSGLSWWLSSVLLKRANITGQIGGV
ncbi:multidrug ABC transporter permease [Dolosigranulum pigrum]|uniref:multidrug ABC transporter permease n=2 Tax=Dolosigranulum pigrum TaxID=29394 RepID=UPI000DC00B5B|nr:multidrug ABC transporter permease [Dolosigranulum pigrum]QTJ37483.1 multidrug ABC transporter permease [Dolosigranulum pigrum]QTJ42657.1 multidrug ABC transporter permease [Dolosigranulum pigrum]QTJ46051.1 multidrug ABC transporter permease [Dolosigranulum pigrum]QTJ49452.1 multidrug ABC transporter permease [Dolosigranulum pigrum]QTJ51171.1 multidrug ABC transporter permease [Dolosigranulum pigrum]